MYCYNKSYLFTEPPCYPCSPEWTSPIYFPNFSDCDSVWQCSQGEMTLVSCTPGTVFDFSIQVTAGSVRAAIQPDRRAQQTGGQRYSQTGGRAGTEWLIGKQTELRLEYVKNNWWISM